MLVSPGTLAAVDVYVWLTCFQFSSVEFRLTYFLSVSVQDLVRGSWFVVEFSFFFLFFLFFLHQMSSVAHLTLSPRGACGMVDGGGGSVVTVD